MEWIVLNDINQLAEIDKNSFSKAQLIFKHSIRCSISSVIKNRLYKGELPENIDFYYLDLINYRNISNALTEKYSIEHESPQVLLIKNGACIFNESHSAIYMDDIVENSL